MRRTPLTTTPRRAVPVEMETTEVEDCRDESLAGSGAGFTTDTSLASTDDDSLSRRISLCCVRQNPPLHSTLHRSTTIILVHHDLLLSSTSLSSQSLSDHSLNTVYATSKRDKCTRRLNRCAKLYIRLNSYASFTRDKDERGNLEDRSGQVDYHSVVTRLKWLQSN